MTDLTRSADIPDPRDRTPNEPALLISPAEVLRAYNNFHFTEELTPRYQVDAKVYVWYAEQAMAVGWVRADAYGQSILLVAKIELKIPKSKKAKA